MSQHEHCPDCQDEHQKDLQNLVEDEEISCCQGDHQPKTEKPKSISSRIFSKNEK